MAMLAACPGGQGQEFSGLVFKDGKHTVRRQTVLLAIGRESEAIDSHHAGALGSGPDVSRLIFSQRANVAVTQPLGTREVLKNHWLAGAQPQPADSLGCAHPQG